MLNRSVESQDIFVDPDAGFGRELVEQRAGRRRSSEVNHVEVVVEVLRYAKGVYSNGKSVSVVIMSGGDVVRNLAAGELVAPAVAVCRSPGAVTHVAVLMGGSIGRCLCWSLEAMVAPVGVVVCGRWRGGVVGGVVLCVAASVIYVGRGRGSGLKLGSFT